MASTTRCSRVARPERAAAVLLLALTAGSATAEPLRVIDAHRDTEGRLVLALRFAPDPRVIEALDATVPLCFQVQFSPQPAESIRLCLTHAPLFRHYALYHGGEVQRYRLRTELFSAFEQQRLAAPAYARAVRVRLDHGTLPPPLRVPAFFERAWQLDTGWVRLQ
ncbi:MAG: DUF4390 domain-containing protein [Xanthomonadales bacterium]|nr:DUF4390 domain-containing protein [Xanthomonadales bacterium]